MAARRFVMFREPGVAVGHGNCWPKRIIDDESEIVTLNADSAALCDLFASATS
jgi:hypothetical protein